MGREHGSTKNMSEGDPFRLILAFAVPMLFGTLFQQFYSMVDTIVVGRFLGVNALAAVGSTSAINFMVNGFVIGVATGFAIPVAQQFGAGKMHEMRCYVANIIWLTAIISVAMTAAVALLTHRILVWMRTPDEILGEAYLYIFIIFLGIPVTFLYNATAGIIRALGDSRTPLIFLVLASVVNIVLDIVTIVFLHFDVNGPAYATVFSQGISGILCVFYMIRKFPELRLSREELSPSGRLCKNLLWNGVPMGLQYSITAIGSVILQTAVNTLGAVAVASVTAGQKVIMFFSCVFDALGGTMATWAGQNTGAGKYDRVKEGVFAAMKMGSAWSITAFLILLLFGGYIPLLFVDAGETEVIRRAHFFMAANAAFYIPLTAVNVYRFAIQGMGFSGLAIFSGVFEMVARALVGFIGVPAFGYYAACFASPFAWILADCFLLPALDYCVRTLNRGRGDPLENVD